MHRKSGRGVGEVQQRPLHQGCRGGRGHGGVKSGAFIITNIPSFINNSMSVFLRKQKYNYKNIEFFCQTGKTRVGKTQGKNRTKKSISAVHSYLL